MKIKIFVALVATATIVFISCNWFRSKKKEVFNPLVGEWKLDSIKTGKDTNLVHSLINAAIQDSGKVNLSFTKDSVFSHSIYSTDKVEYSFDKKANQLKIKDSVDQNFAYNKVNDSLITLTAKDSAILFLRKK
jgi:hypothetical protein